MTTDATLDSNLDTAPASSTPSAGARFLAFLTQPFRPRSLGRALYNLVAFPLGLLYFVVLTVGTLMGVPLLLVWIGFLVLAITGALLWGFISFERELARLLLGAELAPMTAPASGSATLTKRLRAFLANPVTWKGAAFLLLKFPLGLVSFTAVVTGFSATAAFLVGPFLFDHLGVRVDFGFFDWRVDSLPEAFVLSLAGFALLFVTLHLLNALGIGWRYLAEGMLGSESHRRESELPESPEPAPAA